jgi:hypothetical protein
LKAAEGAEGILREPAPFILQKSLDDFYVTYELNVYTDHAQQMSPTYSLLHRRSGDHVAALHAASGRQQGNDTGTVSSQRLCVGGITAFADRKR